MRQLWMAVLACACFAGVVSPAAVLAAGGPDKASCTNATTQPAPDNATNLNEIAPSTSRPTFDVALDGATAKDDQIGLPPKTGKRFTSDAGAVSVEAIDWPSAGSRRLDANIALGSAVNNSRTRVVVSTCVDGRSRWDAGRYEGTILISGPKFSDFTYPLVITARFPWPLAVLTLVAAAVVFFAIAFGTSSLIYQDQQEGKKLVGTFLSAAFAIAAMVPVYWSAYLDNPTWGANPGSEFLALGVAGFTAATVGSAAAHRLLGGTQGASGGKPQGEHQQEQHEQQQEAKAPKAHA